MSEIVGQRTLDTDEPQGAQLRFDGTPEPKDLPESADPRIVPCRDCHAREGTYCKRPSGHKAMGYHVSRVRDAAVKEDANRDST